MKITLGYLLITVFAGFAAAAHVKNHFKSNCKGAFLEFKNLAPRSCARAEHRTGGNPPVKGAPSAKFSNMPNNARLFGWQATRDGNFCGALKKRADIGNKGHKCIGIKKTIGQFAGTSWARGGNKKRADEPDLPVGQDESCESTVAPDSIVLDDGHLYKVAGMPDDLYDALYDMAANGTAHTDLPTKFDSFEEDQGGVGARLQDMQGEEEEG